MPCYDSRHMLYCIESYYYYLWVSEVRLLVVRVYNSSCGTWRAPTTRPVLLLQSEDDRRARAEPSPQLPPLRGTIAYDCDVPSPKGPSRSSAAVIEQGCRPPVMTSMAWNLNLVGALVEIRQVDQRAMQITSIKAVAQRAVLATALPKYRLIPMRLDRVCHER